MSRNLTDQYYSLIEQNPENFNLINFNKNTKLEIDTIAEYDKVAKCCHKYNEYAMELLKASRFISAEEVINIYGKNAKELFELQKQGKKLVLISGTNYDKSNFYFALYFLHIFSQLSSNKIQVYESFVNYFYDNGTDVNDVIFIICDDFSYSGRQLTEDIIEKELNYCIEKSINITNTIVIYLCIVGILEKAQNKINEMIKNINNGILFPSHKLMLDIIVSMNAINIKNNSVTSSLDNFNKFFLSKKGIFFSDNKDDDDYYKAQLLRFDCAPLILNEHIDVVEIISTIKHSILSLVYTFYKYPDDSSTFSALCYSFLPIKNGLIIDFEKFCDFFSIKLSDIYKNFMFLEDEESSFIEKYFIDDLFRMLNKINEKYRNESIDLFYQQKDLFVTNVKNYYKYLKNNINAIDKDIAVEFDKIGVNWLIRNDFYDHNYKNNHNDNFSSWKLYNKNVNDIYKYIEFECNNHITPFYKSIKYKHDGKEITLSDYFSQFRLTIAPALTNIYHHKYIKYLLKSKIA